MPRQKKQHLKRRKDDRYACRYKELFFYGDTEDEALAAREEYKKSLKQTLKQSILLADFAQKWLPNAKANAAYSTYLLASCLMEKLLNACGDKPIADIVPSDIKKVYSNNFVGLSDSYIRSAKQLYTALFDAAVADGLCPKNPVREKAAQPHRGTKGGHRAITPQERNWIDHLCLNHRCRPAVMAMLYEGLRPPEAKAFDIDASVDREKEIITLCDFAHRTSSNRYGITSHGKTPKATRAIPLFEPFAEAIKGKEGKLVQTAHGGELTLQAWRVLWQSYVSQMEQEINGMPKRWYRRTREHKKILAEAEALREEGKNEEAKKKEAEIPPWIPFTVRPYDLRHSFATFCRDAGIELNTVVLWMGHVDANMILKIYDEVSTTRITCEAKKLENALKNR